MKTYCGAHCSQCPSKENCRGCVETEGCPFGKPCFIASYIMLSGKDAFDQFRQNLIAEINSLAIEGMKPVTQLFPLKGSYVNLPYSLPNGQQVHFLDDDRCYLGCQVENCFDQQTDRCFGVIADSTFILIAEYGCNGSNPQLILYKQR